MNTKKELNTLMYALNSMGFNIVFIDDTYFLISEWTPADRDTSEHFVVGKDITQNITELMHLHYTGAKEIQQYMYQKIEAMPFFKRKFHGSYSYIFYLS